MSRLVRLALFAIGSALPLAAQTACNSAALGDAAKTVVAVRHSLHGTAVREDDPVVPPAVAAELGQLKDALTLASNAGFACAPAESTPEQMQNTLAAVLHASVSPAAQSTMETKNKKDIGAYGSDLSVQVFQLFGRPRLFEVDFRYGIECGDDNLLLVYEASENSAHPGWQQRLRWDARAYRTVSDAFGDFVMLTPLTGNYHHPTWRFVVAHGHPGCQRLPRRSQFDLDLLTPAADPARPLVDWHFDHGYTEARTTLPRLSTTEDTVDFRIQSADPQSVRAKEHSPKGEEISRFRLAGNGQLKPLPADAPDAPQAANPAGPPTASSPR